MVILGVSFIGIITKLLLAVNVIICFLLIFVVLLQRPKNEGLGAAFGGDTASNIFGAQTTNVLANLTRWLAGLFMVITLALSLLYSNEGEARTATTKYIEDARKKKEADAARTNAEAAVKSALEASKAAVPATTTTPVAVPAPGTPSLSAPATVTPVTPAPAVPETIPATPAPTTPPAPAPVNPTPVTPTPEAAPTKPAESSTPTPAPAPEPAKPAGA